MPCPLETVLEDFFPGDQLMVNPRREAEGVRGSAMALSFQFTRSMINESTQKQFFSFF